LENDEVKGTIGTVCHLTGADIGPWLLYFERTLFFSTQCALWLKLKEKECNPFFNTLASLI